MDYQNDVDRATKARLLLEDQMLQDALKAIEDEVVEQWTDCPARDMEGKEALWQLMRTAQKFRAILIGHIETNKLATAQFAKFEEKRTFRDMLRRAWETYGR